MMTPNRSKDRFSRHTVASDDSTLPLPTRRLVQALEQSMNLASKKGKTAVRMTIFDAGQHIIDAAHYIEQQGYDVTLFSFSQALPVGHPAFDYKEGRIDLTISWENQASKQ